MAFFCECSEEHSDSHENRHFHDWLNNYQFSKQDPGLGVGYGGVLLLLLLLLVGSN
jgi:hypothetical protein